MSGLKDKILQAEENAALEKSPIAALFTQSQPMGAPPSAPVAAPGQSQFRDLPADALEEMEQPFQIHDDYVEELKKSITERGVIVRIIVRPHPDKPGIYQIIDGRHRRRAAMEKGYTLLPCEIRQLDDVQAELLTIETTLQQRPGLLPSEKAKAYKKQLELLSHQGKRTSAQIEQKSDSENNENGLEPLGQKEYQTSRQNVGKLESADSVDDDKSGRQVQRYIRLTYLMRELLEAVDTGNLGVGAGVSLSYLSTKDQEVVYQYFFVDHRQKIGGNLADALRFSGEKAPLSEEKIKVILSPAVKAKPIRKVSVQMKPLRKFFPAEATPAEIEKKIIQILTEYFDVHPLEEGAQK